jgi:hypothetical protein
MFISIFLSRARIKREGERESVCVYVCICMYEYVCIYMTGFEQRIIRTKCF